MGQTSANSLGVGFKSINIGDTKFQFKFSLTAGGKIGKNELILLGGYTFIDAIPLNPEISYGEDVNGNELNYYNTSSLGLIHYS